MVKHEGFQVVLNTVEIEAESLQQFMQANGIQYKVLSDHEHWGDEILYTCAKREPLETMIREFWNEIDVDGVEESNG